jgi:hypothetical protein
VIYSSAPSPASPGMFAIVRAHVGTVTVECDGFASKRRADTIAAHMNSSYEAAEIKALRSSASPPERHLVKGFYTESDAD